MKRLGDQMLEQYKTIAKDSEAMIIEKKSKFIATVYKVTSPEEAEAYMVQLRKKYYDATHNCFAYQIGEKDEFHKASDDGEPQGTAGIPILEVMKKSNITDCAVVVTRYFGGILLGAGGLTRAYTKGASVALKAAGVVEKVKGVKMTLEMEYDMLGKFQYKCNEKNWHIEDIEYTDKVFVNMLAEVEVSLEIEKASTEISNGKIIINKEDEKIYFKEENRLYEAL